MTTTHKGCGSRVAMMIPESSGFVQRFTSEIQGKEADARIQDLRNKLYTGFGADINNIDPASRHTTWLAYNAYTDILTTLPVYGRA